MINPHPPHIPAGELLTHGDGDEAHGWWRRCWWRWWWRWRRNLSPGWRAGSIWPLETKIVMVATLGIVKESVLLGLRVFGVYKESPERRGRDDARGAGGTRWRAPGEWVCHPRPFGPPALVFLIQNPNLLLLVKSFRGIFPRFYFLQNSQKWDFAKNSVRFCSFYSSMWRF